MSFARSFSSVISALGLPLSFLRLHEVPVSVLPQMIIPHITHDPDPLKFINLVFPSLRLIQVIVINLINLIASNTLMGDNGLIYIPTR